MSGLGAFLSGLGQGGMQLAQHLSDTKRQKMQETLERERLALQQSAQVKADQRDDRRFTLEKEGMDRADGRTQDAQNWGRAQFVASNYGGQENVDDATVKLMEQYLPTALTRTTKVDATTGEDIEGLPQAGTFSTSFGIRDTMPSSVRNALTKAEADGQKNAVREKYLQDRLQIDRARVEISKMGTNISAQQVEIALERLAQAEEDSKRQFDLGLARLEVSQRGQDMGLERGASNGMDSLINFMPPGMRGSAPTAAPRVIPPRVTMPSRTGGGATESTSSTIDDLINGLTAFVERKTKPGGGR